MILTISSSLKKGFGFFFIFERCFGKKNNTITSVRQRFRPIANGSKFKYNSEGHNHNFAKKHCAQRAAIRQTQITEGWQTKKVKKYM